MQHQMCNKSRQKYGKNRYILSTDHNSWVVLEVLAWFLSGVWMDNLLLCDLPHRRLGISHLLICSPTQSVLASCRIHKLALVALVGKGACSMVRH